MFLLASLPEDDLNLLDIKPFPLFQLIIAIDVDHSQTGQDVSESFCPGIVLYSTE